MRDMRKAGLLFTVVVLAGVSALAGQPININSLPAGTWFCPAPGADNSEFMSSYFSIDAQTGQMTRHDAGSGPVGVTPEPVAREEVLFVSPPISVENVYVPPPGGPARPPQTRATGVYRQPRQQPIPQAYQPVPQARPQQYAARPQAYSQPYPQPQRPAYVQPRQSVHSQQQYQQPYPSHAYAQPRPAPQQAYPYPPQPYPQPQHLQTYPQQSYLR